MLQKCANPSCCTPFRSLREGKLFLAESLPPEPGVPFNGNRPKRRRREHFWLCEPCSAQFTLRLDAERGMLTVPINDYVIPRVLTRAAGQRH